MVMVTGARLASRIKRQFGDESGVQVTDNDVILWLNDAMVEAAVQNSNINLKRATVASVVGQFSYALPDAVNLAGVHSISYRASSATPYTLLEYLPVAAFNELFPDWENSTSKDVPLFYTSDSTGNFKVHPAPAVANAQGFSVLYNAFFAEYTDLNAVMSISPRYFQYLLEYCLMKAYEMDENWEAADRKASFIQSTLNSLHSDDTNLNQGKYPLISSLPEDL